MFDVFVRHHHGWGNGELFFIRQRNEIVLCACVMHTHTHTHTNTHTHTKCAGPTEEPEVTEEPDVTEEPEHEHLTEEEGSHDGSDRPGKLPFLC